MLLVTLWCHLFTSHWGQWSPISDTAVLLYCMQFGGVERVIIKWVSVSAVHLKEFVDGDEAVQYLFSPGLWLHVWLWEGCVAWFIQVCGITEIFQSGFKLTIKIMCVAIAISILFSLFLFLKKALFPGV